MRRLLNSKPDDDGKVTIGDVGACLAGLAFGCGVVWLVGLVLRSWL